MQQGLWHALEQEMSVRKQFDNRTAHSFETLKESLQVPLDDMQEDLAKRARERAQKAWEQFASSSMTTTSPADMVAQAAQAARMATNSTYADDTVPVVPLHGGNRSQQPVQAHMRATVQLPPQHPVSMEDTHICGGGDGAAGPRHPMTLNAQTVHSTQLKGTAGPPVPYQDNSTVHVTRQSSLPRTASDPADVVRESSGALSSEAQVAPQSSCVDGSDLSSDINWRERYQEINRRIESGYLNQAEAVELALRALSAEEAPGVSRVPDSDGSLGNTFFSNIAGHSPMQSGSDIASLAQPGGLTSGQVQASNRYLLRHSAHDGSEFTATARSSP
jgi:hypothetical protein